MISVANASIIRQATILSTSCPAQAAIAAQCRRQLSMSCEQSINKLNEILEEYRANNYRQTFPKRFQKDIIKAASKISSNNSSAQSDGAIISAEGIEHVLNNISAGHKMPRIEIEAIFCEIGVCPLESASSESGSNSTNNGSSCVISVDQMFNLLSKK
mmetsp:Transcript_436/g.884  ORF Transcript_436/g.884 Transcript_436/m.884 type:complete len:158 (+) Transcript_436:169-642(+)|eukprot:CAMPEP_0171342596 /NCGR_PEP_ID=MMETSP0878-20121228/14841_1 /TAXON_ID=67004 /ORGANISM="Thalassiosira weissflogii, Strain CCMP1336" /LENGTH=157 /DNA_ID=CAMNT_0011845313 /DNA_START=159 /DNA_END=632 /DNA_ORIENTATION=-